MGFIMTGKRIRNIFSMIEKGDVDDYFWEYFELRPDDRERKEYLHRDWMAHVSKLVEFGKPHGKVVAEGIGFGVIEYYMISLCDDIEEIVGIELDEGKVRSLNKIMKELGIDRIRAVCGDARKVDYDEHFDYLTLFDVLEHAYTNPYEDDTREYKNDFDQRALVEGVSRHLRPGGTVFIFSANGLNPNILRWSRRLRKTGTIENPVNPIYIRSVLRSLGYSDISIKPYARNWEKKSGWKRTMGDLIERYTPLRLFTTPTFLLKAKKKLHGTKKE